MRCLPSSSTTQGPLGGNISWCTRCAASARQHYCFLQPLRQWHINNEYKLNPLLPWHRTSEQPNRKDVFCRGRIKLRYSKVPEGSSEILRVQYCVLKEACKTGRFVWGEDFCWLQVNVCGIKWRITSLVTWRESFQQTLYLNNSFNAFFRSTFLQGLDRFLFHQPCGCAPKKKKKKKKRDRLITVIHMKWIVYLQLNPAVLAPCGFPPVSIPICWLNFCLDVRAAIHQQVFHWTFISIWPQAHRDARRENENRDRMRRWRMRRLLHLALNNLPVTPTVSITTSGNCAVFYLVTVVMLWLKRVIRLFEIHYGRLHDSRAVPPALWGCKQLYANMLAIRMPTCCFVHVGLVSWCPKAMNGCGGTVSNSVDHKPTE